MAREEKKRATREALYTAALDLIRERGYGAVSVEEITARAGTAKGTFYRYFPTKAHVVAEWYEQMLRPRTVEHTPGLSEALDLILSDRLALLEREPALMAAKVANETSSEAIAEAERAVDGAIKDLLEQVLRAAMPTGKRTPSPAALADLILCVLTGAARRWRYAEPKETLERETLLEASRKRMAVIRTLLSEAGLVEPQLTGRRRISKK